MKTFLPKNETIERKWYVLDADGAVLGRMASRISGILRGKNKPIYIPFMDTGDYVIVINAEKIQLTGNKLDQKEYVYHTGYPGGQKRVKYRELLKRKPEFVIMHAVSGMMPKGPLGRKMLKKLKVYAGPNHEHEAQKPVLLSID